MDDIDSNTDQNGMGTIFEDDRVNHEKHVDTKYCFYMGRPPEPCRSWFEAKLQELSTLQFVAVELVFIATLGGALYVLQQRCIKL